MDQKKDLTLRYTQNPKIDTTQIYAEHATATVLGPYIFLLQFPAYPCALLTFPLMVIHTAFIPLSTTVGAGISTGVSASHRTLLTKEVLNQALDEIENLMLTDNQSDNSRSIAINTVNSLVKNITDYRSCSFASAALASKLKQLIDEEKQDIKRLLTEITAKMEKNKIQELQKSKNPESNSGFFKISQSAVIHYLSTPAVQTRINNQLALEAQGIIRDSCNKKLETIFSYLLDPENTGKKMQHIIVNTLAESKKAELESVIGG